jgi:hypothetical protein
MPKIALNGRSLPDASIKWLEEDGEKWPEVTSRSGSIIRLVVGDTLTVDGDVILGPMTGWKFEDRKAGRSGRGAQMLRSMFYKGEHDSGCEMTEDGWLCVQGCTVIDAPTQPVQMTNLDSLIDFIGDAARKGFQVYWTLSRKSLLSIFVNGRCAPGRSTVTTNVWHTGTTWTKRGARREMKRLITPPEDR